MVEMRIDASFWVVRNLRCAPGIYQVDVTRITKEPSSFLHDISVLHQTCMWMKFAYIYVNLDSNSRLHLNKKYVFSNPIIFFFIWHKTPCLDYCVTLWNTNCVAAFMWWNRKLSMRNDTATKAKIPLVQTILYLVFSTCITLCWALEKV